MPELVDQGQKPRFGGKRLLTLSVVMCVQFALVAVKLHASHKNEEVKRVIHCNAKIVEFASQADRLGETIQKVGLRGISAQ